MWFWLFIASLVVIFAMMFYIRWLLTAVASINQDVENVNSLIKVFHKHIQVLHEMEMFYGDETLQSLLQHASELSVKLEGLDLVLNDDQPEEEVAQVEN